MHCKDVFLPRNLLIGLNKELNGQQLGRKRLGRTFGQTGEEINRDVGETQRKQEVQEVKKSRGKTKD